MITINEMEEVEVFEEGLEQPIKQEEDPAIKPRKQFPLDKLSDEWF